MEAAFGRLHNSGAGAFGARPTVVESIMLDGEAANIAIQDPYPTIPIPNEGCFSIKPNSMPSLGMGMVCLFLMGNKYTTNACRKGPWAQAWAQIGCAMAGPSLAKTAEVIV